MSRKPPGLTGRILKAGSGCGSPIRKGATCSLTAAPGLPFHRDLSMTTSTSPVVPVILGRVRVSDESPQEAITVIARIKKNAGVLMVHCI